MPTFTSRTGSTTPGHLSNAVPDADKVIDQAASGAHETVDRLAERAAPHVRRIEEGARDVADSVEAGVQRTRQAGDTWTRALRDSVRDRPLGALVVAVAIGAVMARLSR